MADDSQTLPAGSSYLYNADAQAILEEAPDLETGNQLLEQAYQSRAWDKPDAAAQTTADYGEKLRQRFQQNNLLPNADTLTAAPIDLDQVEGQRPTGIIEDAAEGLAKMVGNADPGEIAQQVDKINNWEKANLDRIGTATDDPKLVIGRDQLTKSVSNTAADLRRQAIATNSTWLSDAFARASESQADGIAKLVGFDSYPKKLKEYTDPSRDDDLSSTIESITGNVSTAAVVGPLARVYLTAQGAGQTRDVYSKTLDATGDTGKAYTAAALEGAGQAVQIYAGGKVFGGIGRAIGGNSLPGRVIGGVAAEAASGAASTALSNEAATEGIDPKRKLSAGVAETSIIQGVFGGFFSALHTPKTPPPAGEDPSLNTETGVTPPIEQHVIGAPVNSSQSVELADKSIDISSDPEPQQVASYDFKTKDGSTYARTPEGATVRTKGDNSESYHPLDRTFFVDSDTATELAKRRADPNPENGRLKLYTDGNNLIAKDDSGITEIPTKETAALGDHPVEVNKPKNPNGNAIIYQSHIGQPITEIRENAKAQSGDAESIAGAESGSGQDIQLPTTNTEVSTAGAQSAYENGNFKQTRVTARKQVDENTLKDIRDTLSGDGEEYLQSSYEARTNKASLSAADAFIGDAGLEAATKHVLNDDTSVHNGTDAAIAVRLYDHYTDAAQKALDAGDKDTGRKLARTATLILDQVGTRASQSGQYNQALNMLYRANPEVHVAAIEQGMRDGEIDQAAKDNDIPPEELKNAPAQLKDIDQKIKDEESKKEPPQEGQPEEPDSPALQQFKKQAAALKARVAALRKAEQQAVDKFPEKEQNELKDLFKISRNYTGDAQQAALREIAARKAKLDDKYVTKRNLLRTYWMSDVLSNPSTVAGIAHSNAAHLVGNALAYAVTRPTTAFPDFVKGAGSALKQISSIVKSELSGNRLYRPDVESFETTKSGLKKSPKLQYQFPDFVNEAPDWVKKTGLNNVGYALRALSAVHSSFYKTFAEGQASAIAGELARKGKYTGEDFRNKIGELLGNSTGRYEDAYKQASQEGETLKKLGVSFPESRVKLRAWSIMEETRPDSLQQRTHEFAAKQSMLGPNQGFLGGIAEGMQKMANAPLKLPGTNTEIKPVKFLIPFVHIGTNIANAMIDYSPLAASRVREFDKGSLERSNQIGKILLGTTLTGTVAAIAQSYLKDKDPYFAIIGAGDKKYSDNAAEGKKAWSVKMGDKYYSYENTPLALMLGAIGTWHDNERAKKAGDDSADGAVATAITILGGVANSFMHQTFLKSLGDFVDALNGDPTKSVAGALVVNPLRGFVPGIGALNAVSKMINNPIETHNDIYSKFISGIPAVENIGTKPALNAFGEATEKDLAGRLSFLSRFYSDRSTDPAWRFLAENNYAIPDIGYTVKLPKHSEGSRQTQVDNLGAKFDGILTPDERYDFVQTAGPLIKQKVLDYANRYGTSGFQQSVQDGLKKDISRIHSQVLRQMFVH